MVEKKLVCEIITPQETVYSGEVDMVIAPGVEGELGILPLHAPLITLLREGEVRLKIADKTKIVKVKEGYTEVCEDKVIVLVPEAEVVS